MKKISLLAATLILMAGCSKKQDFDATGTFEAKEITISAEVSGKIIEFPVEEGSFVKADELLCVIDTTQLCLQRGLLLSQQSAILRGKPDVNKQVASLRSQIAKQQREVARIENLLKGDVATQKQLDDAQTQLNVLLSQLEATLSTLGTSSATIEQNAASVEWQIKQIDEQIARSRVPAPFGGIVLAKYAEAGELAVTGKPLLKIADLDQMYLRAYFTSDQLSKVKNGQKVKVFADFGGNERYEYEGTVTWIASESEFTPKSIQTKSSRANLVYAAKIAVKNDGKLKIGLYGEVAL